MRKNIMAYIIVRKINVQAIPCLLVYNNIASTKSIVFIFHKLLENKESELSLAYKLAEEGFFVVTIDMRGHGERENSYEKIGLYEFNNLIKDCFGTANDALEIITYFKTSNEFKLDYNDLTCIGISIGANIALMTGYLSETVNRVVSLIGSLDWEDSIKNNKFISFRFHSRNKSMIQYENVENDILKYNPIFNYPKLKRLPKLLFSNGLLDATIPIESATLYYKEMEKIYHNQGCKKLIEMKTYAKTGHYVTYKMTDDLFCWLKNENK